MHPGIVNVGDVLEEVRLGEVGEEGEGERSDWSERWRTVANEGWASEQGLEE